MTVCVCVCAFSRVSSCVVYSVLCTNVNAVTQTCAHRTSQWQCTSHITVAVHITHHSGSAHRTSQRQCTSHITAAVHITLHIGSAHRTSHWQCTSHITVAVRIVHHSGSAHCTSQWQCTSHFTVAVHIAHYSGSAHHNTLAVHITNGHTSNSRSTALCREPLSVFKRTCYCLTGSSRQPKWHSNNPSVLALCLWTCVCACVCVCVRL